MKRQLIFALLPLFLIAGCKKGSENPEVKTENPEVQTDTLYNVKLNLGGFSSEMVDLPSRSDLSPSTRAIPNDISTIEYFIYNSGGILVKSIKQLSSKSNFGVINEQLPSGNYEIYIFGYSNLGSYTVVIGSQYIICTPHATGFGDFFRKTIQVTVSDQDQAQNVNLDRVVGKVEVKLTDIIPSDVSKITLSVKNENFLRFNITGNSSGSLITIDRPVSSSEIGQANITLGTFIYPLESGTLTSDVNIRAYNSAGGLIADKIIEDVKIEKNRKTILTGKLFTDGGSAESGFTIGFNSDWNTSDNVIEF